MTAAPDHKIEATSLSADVIAATVRVFEALEIHTELPHA
jgi:hypothetical protein